MVIATGCSSSATSPGDDIRTSFSAVVHGTVLQPDGGPARGVSIEILAYPGDACSIHLLASKAQTTDESGRYALTIPAAPLDSLCLIVKATPPAGNGAGAVTDSGIVVRRNTRYTGAAGQFAFDSVLVDFTIK
jgi:hypothetical protein